MKNSLIDIRNDIFSDKDINDFLGKVDSAKWEDPIFEKEYSNYYLRTAIEVSDFLEYKSKLELLLEQTYKHQYFLQTKGVWINKVKTTTNTKDAFHLDNSDLTIVTYLNDDFTDGDFEYMDDNENIVHITPTKGMSLIMNNKLLHRVLPVTKGERLSLICFFDLKRKETKSVL